MVGLDGRPRICDFGLAQPFKLSPPRECVGTIFNMAPEVIDPRPGRGRAWGFGAVCAHVILAIAFLCMWVVHVHVCGTCALLCQLGCAPFSKKIKL